MMYPDLCDSPSELVWCPSTTEDFALTLHISAGVTGLVRFAIRAGLVRLKTNSEASTESSTITSRHPWSLLAQGYSACFNGRFNVLRQQLREALNSICDSRYHWGVTLDSAWTRQKVGLETVGARHFHASRNINYVSGFS